MEYENWNPLLDVLCYHSYSNNEKRSDIVIKGYWWIGEMPWYALCGAVEALRGRVCCDQLCDISWWPHASCKGFHNYPTLYRYALLCNFCRAEIFYHYQNNLLIFRSLQLCFNRLIFFFALHCIPLIAVETSLTDICFTNNFL